MVGIKDVARDAGVSVGTVSNVINRPDLVSEETRRRVQSVIDRLGYVRSESARQLRAGHSRIMALLVLDMGNPFFVDVARGAERTARESGLGVMVCNSAQNPAEEADYLSLFAEQRVRGVLLTPADATGRNIAAFRRHNIPFVLVDRVAEGTTECSVSVDDVAGGALAVRHLVDGGHRSIAYVSGPPGLNQVRDRREGARHALAEAGLPPQTLRELPTERLDVAAGRDAGARLLGLADRPTAVFCANDLLALGVLQAMFAAGVSVPDEVAIVGYDDIEFAAAAAVPLTSVRQPAVTMGAMAAELLLEETETIGVSSGPAMSGGVLPSGGAAVGGQDRGGENTVGGADGAEGARGAGGAADADGDGGAYEAHGHDEAHEHAGAHGHGGAHGAFQAIGADGRGGAMGTGAVEGAGGAGGVRGTRGGVRGHQHRRVVLQPELVVRRSSLRRR